MTALAPAATAWHRGPLAAFDIESTGKHPDTDRIVTAALVRIHPGQPTETHTWLSDADGMDIDPEAAAIHGITTERAHAEGMPARQAVDEITVALRAVLADGIPLVLMNATFDMTMLDRECRRHGRLPLDQPAPVIDVRVLDKAVDPYRKGGRKLTDLCQAYGVKLDQAHDAGGDALGALRVAWAIANRHPELQIEPAALHERQIRWAASQMASFAAYRRKNGNPLDDENGEWPVRTLPGDRIPAQRPSA